MPIFVRFYSGAICFSSRVVQLFPPQLTFIGVVLIQGFSNSFFAVKAGKSHMFHIITFFSIKVQ